MTAVDNIDLAVEQHEACPDCSRPGRIVWHYLDSVCPFRRRERSVCTVDGCEKSAERVDNGRRGMCRTHYSETVATEGLLPRPTPEERFLSYLRLSAERWHGDTPCIEWTGCLNHGYGQFQLATNRPVPAYRWSYLNWVGPIPDGLELDHLCRNRACVNPTHLEPVTHAENIRRGGWGAHVEAQRSATHCIRGHEFTPENTYVDSNGCRRCRTCQASHNRAYRHRLSERRRSS